MMENTQNKFDYIIVGGGSAGATLASRLSENPEVSVCLLEAGGQGDSFLIKIPMAVITIAPGRFKINNWAYETLPQQGLNGRQGFQPRGKALGGSSAINAMLYVRGTPSDYDGWAADGCKGWAWKDVLPYFKRAENNENGDDDWHGTTGPLHVSNQKSPRPITHAFVKAANQMQIPTNADFNGPTQEGVGLYQVTQFYSEEQNGERCSAAAAYLEPIAERSNLTIITKAHATKILFEGKRAFGVEYRIGRKTKTVLAAKEVMLCGGVFNSPQLLQLSGVGRREDIEPHGIEMVHELDGVGQNLQDHLDFTLSYKSKVADVVGFGLVGFYNFAKHLWQWKKDGTGLLATPYAEGGAFLKTKPDLKDPDIQLHFVVAEVDDHGRKLHWGYGYSCHVCVLRPYSRGSVRIGSSDPLQPPLIDPQFLSDDRDLKTLITGVKLTRGILRAPAFEPFRDEEVTTQDAQTDDDWECYIRDRADTIYHPVGTCKMGVDKMAVVDAQLRVHGLEAIRVVDASIMPNLIGGNTNAPTIMIAEKLADMIKGVKNRKEYG